MKNRAGWHFVIWFAVVCVWMAVSRDSHPTLLLNALATCVLVTVAALAVYADGFLLSVRVRRQCSRWRYVAELMMIIAALDVISVVAIQLLYDALWGPDPRRFGFWSNILYEAMFIALHLAIVRVFLATMRSRRTTE